ncbi:hypothetical protein D1815_02275 [Aquimarina sp. AD1]|uniref:hypothetical protein n=1 Tax=Aquimarina sp. (strain AD1) TaxID=1714848 RepID=UPI000E52C901|nr:hypothetical protein [Aquimarina sp. AD1]AXT54633.1 hypothetical protein D1815_02275 [Aquimarina sp. AD1]RKN03329.1 hypothetical protein D7035_22375 [Aquimarina sp. AD1]
MKSGIKITDSELEFIEFSSKEIGLALYCKSFKMNLEEIQLIGISPRMVLDDETLFILIIDKFNRIYPLPDEILGTNGLKNLEKHFDLYPIQKEWQKFEHNDHYGKVDKVIYPKEKYWNDLFEKDWKLKIRVLYSWLVSKSFYGNLNKKNVG